MNSNQNDRPVSARLSVKAFISKYIEFAIYVVMMVIFAYHAIEALAVMNGYTKLPEFAMFEQGIPDNRQLILLQCVLGMVVIHVPPLLSKLFKFKLPFAFTFIFDVFLLSAIYLGEVQDFYWVVPHWDDVLHALSSVMICIFAFIFVFLLNRKKTTDVTQNISPLFIALFAFCFTAMAGAFWEIYEFTFDFFDLNMQKYRFGNWEKTPRIGRDALFDTMKDIIVDTLGGLVTAIYGYISLINKKGFIHECVLGGNTPKNVDPENPDQENE